MTIPIKDILAAAAEHAGMDLQALLVRRKPKDLVRARQHAWWLCRRIRPDVGYPELGRISGGFDHTTVLYAVSAVDERRRSDPFERVELDELLVRIAPDGPAQDISALDYIDARLIAAVLAGRSVADSARHARIGPDLAAGRLTVIAEACAAALGRGLLAADLYSHKSDALLEPRRPQDAVAPVEVIEPVALAPALQPLRALPPPTRLVDDDMPPPRKASPAAPHRRDLAPAAPARIATARTASGPFSGFGGKPPSQPAPARASPRLSEADRALINAAIAKGKLRQVEKDDGSELVFDPDKHAWARYPREELEFVPETGWRKAPSARARGNAAKSRRAS